jgi:trk system potassium uptake protein TrkA
VLTALGISEIAHPEEESAERWSKKLCMTGLVDSFELNSNYSIVEAVVPDKYVGKSIQEIGFREKYELLVLTILKAKSRKQPLGKVWLRRYSTVYLDRIPYWNRAIY